ncbi:MAG: FKBP-type peptidyl-prolyl cis-trans isomerase [Desulfuromonadales bacterium]|nr:FKBP-type peptidyl-prolyl cis-trans isomerase [Desulfuromonadales bacterium]
MLSILYRFTLLLLFVGLTSNTWAFERKAEWSQYSRSKPNSTTVKLNNDVDRVSYSIGMSIGEDIKARDIEINPDILARGITDMITGENAALTKEEAMQALTKLQEQMAKKQSEEMERISRTNLQNGQEFLAQNAKKPGVTVTETGLQYEILSAGTGATPTAEDVVVVDYRGTSIDGKEFDSSYSRGEPVEFSVKSIIPGWTEALLMMKEGAKWRIVLPADLAYGIQGAAPVIEPNSTLVFEVELKSVKK